MNFFGSKRGIQQESGFSKGICPFSQSSSSSASSSYNNQQQHWPSSNESTVLMDSSPADEVTGGEYHHAMIEREHMFDKVVTPSDVGKLNRLVIPKQHAERYFPLDSSGNDKGGLLLTFEDRNGKPWRFRYSYWNSSQSYVMTKGWSRFVKEKKLYAGDIVSFQRGAGELAKHRLFIDWRRRPDEMNPFMAPHHFSNGRLFSLQSPYPHSYMYGIGNTSPYYMSTCLNNMMRSGVAAPQGCSSVVEARVFNSVPVVQGKVAAKRLRLFGVNMDCPMDHSDVVSSSSIPTTYSHFSSSLRNLKNSPMPSEESSEKGKPSMSLDLDV